MTDPEAVCRAVFDDVWNKDDHAALAGLQDVSWSMDTVSPHSERPGHLAMLDLMNLYKSFVPDIRFRVRHQKPDGDDVVTQWEAEGHHAGMALGVHPTRKTVRIAGEMAARVLRNGRIAAVHGTWDLARFGAQVGTTTGRLLDTLAPAKDRVALRTVWSADGEPFLLFPTLSLPGWLTWRRHTDALAPFSPVVNFQFVGNRLAFEGGDVTDGYGVEAENDALQRSLDRAGISGPFHVVGHSAGGTAALSFALDRPHLVHSLTLIEPGPAWVLKSSGQFDAEMRAFVRRRTVAASRVMTKRRYAAFLKATYMDPAYNPWKSPAWSLLCAYMQNVKFRVSFYAQTGDLARLDAATFPVLLVRGTQSDSFHHRIVCVLKQRIPHAEVVDMPGGHVPHFGQGVQRFVDRLLLFRRAASAGAAFAGV